MAVKHTPVARQEEPPPARTRYIGLRMTERDAATLAALADKEGVGLSTFARLVLETYVREHGKAVR